MYSGMPRISFTFAVSCSAAVTQVVPSPRARERETEAPRCLDDRVEQAGAPAAIVSADDRRDDDGGDFGEMFGQVRGRRHHLLAWVAGAVKPLGGGGHERQRRLAIELAQLVLHPLFADDDPSSAAEVAAGRRLLGEIDAIEQQLVVDQSLEVEPPAHPRVVASTSSIWATSKVMLALARVVRAPSCATASRPTDRDPRWP